MKMQIRNPISRIREAVTRTRHSHTSQSQVTPIDHSDAMDILASERRRWAIEYLADQSPDDVVTVSDLAEAVAAKENDCTVKELTSKQRERVYIALCQQHLVTMEDVVDYDKDRKEVTPTETPARLWSANTAFQRSLNG